MARKFALATPHLVYRQHAPDAMRGFPLLRLPAGQGGRKEEKEGNPIKGAMQQACHKLGNHAARERASPGRHAKQRSVWRTASDHLKHEICPIERDPTTARRADWASVVLPLLLLGAAELLLYPSSRDRDELQP